jgi:carbamoylphosphate synthase small subunit
MDESRKVFVPVLSQETVHCPAIGKAINLQRYLKENNVVSLEGIDTRQLVRHIRNEGMRELFSSGWILKTQKSLQCPAWSDAISSSHIWKALRRNKGVVDVVADKEPAGKEIQSGCTGLRHQRDIFRLLVRPL